MLLGSLELVQLRAPCPRVSALAGFFRILSSGQFGKLKSSSLQTGAPSDASENSGSEFRSVDNTVIHPACAGSERSNEMAVIIAEEIRQFDCNLSEAGLEQFMELENLHRFGTELE